MYRNEKRTNDTTTSSTRLEAMRASTNRATVPPASRSQRTPEMSAAQGVQYEKKVGMNPVSRLLSGTRLSAAMYGIIGTSFMICAWAAIVASASLAVVGALWAAIRALSTAAFL